MVPQSKNAFVFQWQQPTNCLLYFLKELIDKRNLEFFHIIGHMAQLVSATEYSDCISVKW